MDSLNQVILLTRCYSQLPCGSEFPFGDGNMMKDNKTAKTIHFSRKERTKNNAYENTEANSEDQHAVWPKIQVTTDKDNSKKDLD